mmetsp:Transcript_12407/g.24857  ORF Transcript_12407/g.24857 Transcript_12407/m.24857 type:complete len:85 (-) Transcript_12407:165-419(-)
MALNSIPPKVKDCLGELTPARQVVLRGYIATLRADLKDKDGKIRQLEDNGNDNGPAVKKASSGCESDDKSSETESNCCSKGCCD